MLFVRPTKGHTLNVIRLKIMLFVRPTKGHTLKVTRFHHILQYTIIVSRERIACENSLRNIDLCGPGNVDAAAISVGLKAEAIESADDARGREYCDLVKKENIERRI